MRKSFFLLPALMLLLGAACKNNKRNAAVSGARHDSVVQALSPGADSHVESQASLPNANVPAFDTNSFFKAKDSMMSQLKNSLGKNGGMVDSVMNLLNQQSAGTAKQTSISKTAVPYHEPLPGDYVIPVAGNGRGLVYEYAGGSLFKGQKNGIVFTISLDSLRSSGWNIYFDGHAQINAMNLNVNTHYSFLMDKGFTRILLNDDHQVYTTQKTEQVIREKRYTVTDIRVTLIGNEKLHGFDCVHARVSSTTHFMGQTTNNQFDIWRSEEVPGAAQLESTIQVLVSPVTLEIEDDLVKIGCKGAVLKVSSHDATSVVTKELLRITRKDIPGAIFEIPAGYKEDKNAALYSLDSGN